MPTIPIVPDPPDKVFGLSTPDHLYYKLTWELQNLTMALSAEGWEQQALASYHAFNFAVTAHHIIDWIWATTGRHEDSREWMARDLDNKPFNSRRSLREAIEAKYRAIHICGQIANGSKHYETRHPDNNPAVRVSEKWEYRSSENNESAATYILEVRDGERTRPAMEVFSDAVDAWTELFQARYFEDRFVAGDDVPPSTD